MTADSHTTITECSSAEYPKGVLAALAAIGGGRAPGCAAQSPWWANAWLSIALGATSSLAWYAAEPDRPRIFYPLIGIGIGIAWHAITQVFDPTNYHGVCATCGLCSVDDGVKPARTVKQCNDNLAAAGWVVSLDGKREHCPTHLGFY